MEEEKTFFDKVKDLNDNGGIIELSNWDRLQFAQAEYDFIENEKNKIENIKWMLIGLILGILGNFIVMFLYDFFKTQNKPIFRYAIFVIILIFLILLYCINKDFSERKRKIKLAQKLSNMWLRTKSIKIGKPLKRIN